MFRAYRLYAGLIYTLLPIHKLAATSVSTEVVVPRDRLQSRTYHYKQLFCKHNTKVAAKLHACCILIKASWWAGDARQLRLPGG